jgi:hypothetical protein
MQNEYRGINTESWSIQYTDRKADGVNFIIMMNEESAGVIAKYDGFLHFGLNQIKFIPKGSLVQPENANANEI